MSVEHRTADSRNDLVKDRAAGAQFNELAAKYGISVWNARAWCRKAVKTGIATQAQLRMRNIRRSKVPDDTYNAQWLVRIKAHTVLSERGCWIYQGWITARGYGQTTYRGKGCRVHRKTFEILNRVELREDQHVCHSCDVKRCCNPDHLWLGDNGANMLDLVVKGGHYWRSKTHCPQGHEYTPENTYIRPVSKGQRAGSRACKTCERTRMKSPKYRAKANERQRRRRAQNRGVSL